MNNFNLKTFEDQIVETASQAHSAAPESPCAMRSKKAPKLPAGTFEVYHVFQLVGHNSMCRTHGYFPLDLRATQLLVSDLNLRAFPAEHNKAGCFHHNRYRFTRKAAMNIEGRVHLVNVQPIQVTVDLPL